MQQRVKSIETARTMNMEQKEEYPQVMVSPFDTRSPGQTDQDLGEMPHCMVTCLASYLTPLLAHSSARVSLSSLINFQPFLLDMLQTGQRQVQVVRPSKSR